jgi:hypothetical protein
MVASKTPAAARARGAAGVQAVVTQQINLQKILQKQ